MAGFSDYLEIQILTNVFHTGDYSSTLAIALLTSPAIDSENGTFSGPGVEVPNTAGYQRQLLNPSSSNWSVSTDGTGTARNIVPIVFPAASGDWGAIVGMAITENDVYGAGNVLFYGALEVSKTIGVSDTFRFAPGDLSITID